MDDSFDELLKEALMQAMDEDLRDLPQDDRPMSDRQRQRMERLLADPANYARKMLRPWQEKMARAAAMVAVSVGLSALLLSQLSPSACATSLRVMAPRWRRIPRMAQRLSRRCKNCSRLAM